MLEIGRFRTQRVAGCWSGHPRAGVTAPSLLELNKRLDTAPRHDPILGWSFGDAGAGLNDPCGSLLIWDILWFCDSPDSRYSNTSETEWRKEAEAGKSVEQLLGEAAVRLLLNSVASHLIVSRFNTHPELAGAQPCPLRTPGPTTEPQPRSARPSPSLLHDPFAWAARARPAMAERYQVTQAGNMAASAPAGAEEHGGDEEEGGSEVGRRCQPPVSSLSAFSYIPPRRDGPAKLSYFYREAQVRAGAGGRSKASVFLAAVLIVLHNWKGAWRLGSVSRV